MFAAFSDQPINGIGGLRGIGVSHCNRWCWWYCRVRGQCQVTFKTHRQERVEGTEQHTGSKRLRLCFVSDDPVKRGISTHLNDLCCQAHNQTHAGAHLYLLMELMLGTPSLLHTCSSSSLSRISQANMLGFVCFRWRIVCTTLGVATLGLEPPITPGLMLPVSLYLHLQYCNNICVGMFNILA